MNSPTLEPRKTKSLVTQVSRVLREIVAIAVWLLIIIKVFIYDVDLLIVSKYPILQRLYPYKVFFLIAITSVIWLSLGTKRFFKTVIYVATYPIGALPWFIIKTSFKNWPLLLVFLPAIESVVRSIRARFVLGSFTILSALTICITSRPPIVIGCMSLLAAYLVYHYVLRLRTAFRANTLFARIAPGLQKMWRTSIQTYHGNEYKARSGPGADPKHYPKKHVENIKELYMQNLMYAYVAGKLQRAVSARHTDVYFIMALIYSFALTMIVFAFEYFGLFKLDPTSFSHPTDVSFWSFLLFSFNAMLRAGYASVIPQSTLALAFANLELLASAVIGLCLVFILLTSSRERYRQEVKDVADNLASSAKQIERFLDRKLSLRLMDAEAKIIAVDPSFAQVMTSFGRIPTAVIDVPSEPQSPASPTVTQTQKAKMLSDEERKRVDEDEKHQPSSDSTSGKQKSGE
jgi:hypothetical protein